MGETLYQDAAEQEAADEQTAEAHDGDQPCFCAGCGRARSNRAHLYTARMATSHGGHDVDLAWLVGL